MTQADMTFAAVAAAPKVFFSVGEPSGDRHAAALLRDLKLHLPNLQARGLGGPNMQKAGCRLDYELTELAVVGFVEVLPKLREFFRVADQASAIFQEDRPDAVVLVDFPGFNWHIAKRAKEHGIPVFYYLPPQLWAWGQWRVEKIRKYVDRVICNLPFEPQWYADHGIDVDYVGHPFFDDLTEENLDSQLLAQLAQHRGLRVAVLPGSRGREVRHIWPIQLEAIRELSRRFPDVRFSVACLKEIHRQECQKIMTAGDRRLPIDFYVNKTSELIEAADCAFMKSGSVSLEMMARGTPAVVVYHVSQALYTIARRLTDLQSITLPNMIARKKVMPEFLAIGGQRATTIERCVAAVDRLLSDADERALQRCELLNLKNQFGQPGASKRTAKLLYQHLTGQIPMRQSSSNSALATEFHTQMQLGARAAA